MTKKVMHSLQHNKKNVLLLDSSDQELGHGSNSESENEISMNNPVKINKNLT